MIETINVDVVLEEDAKLPYYSTEDAAGGDLYANILDSVVIEPGDRACIPTGVRLAIPTGYELQIRPRSGMALKEGITVLNTPGTIDGDYRGIVGVILINHSKESFTVNSGDRIAQGVFAAFVRPVFNIVSELNTTARGEGGFGHTGKA